MNRQGLWDRFLIHNGSPLRRGGLRSIAICLRVGLEHSALTRSRSDPSTLETDRGWLHLSDGPLHVHPLELLAHEEVVLILEAYNFHADRAEVYNDMVSHLEFVLQLLEIDTDKGLIT